MFKNNRQFAALATVILLLFSSMAICAERLIPFQGRLTDGAGQLIQGVERVTFVIYDEPTGGTALWNEVHEKVSIIGGQVNVLLGSTSNFDDLNNNQVLNEDDADSLDFTNPRYLGITIGVSTNQEMLPRHQLVPSFHARTADHASTATLADRATIATDSEKLGGNLPSYFALAAGTGDNISTLEARLDALDTLVANTRTYIVPTGTVMPFAGDNLPENDYYFCEGQWVTYQNADGSPNLENEALWNVIKFRYGKRDESGTGGEISFRLPDYRGMFLRGHDYDKPEELSRTPIDPDRDSRTGFDIDGNADEVNALGSIQDHQVQNHYHAMGGNNVAANNGGGVGSSFNASLVDWGRYWSNPIIGNAYNGNIGSETRPTNISVRYIIKR